MKKLQTKVESGGNATEFADNQPAPTVGLLSSTHEMEQEIQRCLLSHPSLSFSSLVIHRIPDGICLEGVVEVDNGCPDVCRLVNQMTGLTKVLNHLVVHRRRQPPAKG